MSKRDVNLFHKGRNYSCYKFMGAHHTNENGVEGYRFTVWAPNALNVSVLGDFNSWNGKNHRMKKINASGIWSIFIPELSFGEIYKYEVVTKNGDKKLKSDPYAFFSEKRPNTASITFNFKKYVWRDEAWIDKRRKANIKQSPLNIYELHLGSWKRNKKGEFLNYKDYARLIPRYVKYMGFSHIEIMPLMEHPLDDSWGYQVTGYYSPTSRFGNPDSLKYFIDCCHREGIGVILDWVPGHFCKDEHGLYRFDGTPLYEYKEENRCENRGWGAANFDLGKPEVISFLISNALFWLKEYHIDGLRVDAVANMLYLDYDKGPMEWTPNEYGGNENIEAIKFLQHLNEVVSKECPDVFIIAEESTAWPKVTGKVSQGALGFSFKWNMGWMNDMLNYIQIDPIYRKYNHKLVTFSMMYSYSENFILPISHDEVVHGKKSLIDKMWGDYWNKFAGLRAFLAYMYCHPGKKTLFMGCEFAQFIEWRFNEGLEWHLLRFEMHKKIHYYVKTLNDFYKNHRALWELDFDVKGFQWIDADNQNQSIIIFMRKARNIKDTLIIVCNFTPKVYYDYKIGVPFLGTYREVLNTDSREFGGSGQIMGEILFSQKERWHNQEHFIKIKVPPMATLVLGIENIDED
ncbi:glycogen branching protein [Fervidicella metallireducens AeB]|uniref:1,4-alpha-glucan branching enzyme GlgB n=1 Tax=Fervidicella metallireducens AeB TaxID=1403537 RepID=A0A017RSM2_9CLOT|nr:glycogen branching protein [Fervidicella metallireducens AeB]